MTVPRRGFAGQEGFGGRGQELEILRSRAIAIEYVLWAAGQDLSPKSALAGLGLPWTAARVPNWDDAVLMIGIAHRRIAEPAEIVPLRRAG